MDIGFVITTISGDSEDYQSDLAVRLDAYGESGDKSFGLSIFLYTYPEIISFSPK